MSNLLTFARMSEDDARAFLERLRWPDGPVCPNCGTVGEAKRMASRNGTAAENKLRGGVLNCRACRKPFSVTVGTIFEGSHVPLSKWLMAFYLFASSKKSLSALQLQRQLGLGSYRTAWHLSHRVRFAMSNDPMPDPLRGDVEADETYVGGKPRVHGEATKGRRGRGTNKIPVAVLVERDGGRARAKVVANVTGETLKGFIRANVASKGGRILTDEWVSYNGIGKEYEGGHARVEHGVREYARGDVHTNTAESFNGLFKRSINGAWHHISPEHMQRYLDEQVFRWSHRRASDGDRTLTALGRVDGVRLYYKKPKGSGASGDAGLVADGSA